MKNSRVSKAKAPVWQAPQPLRRITDAQLQSRILGSTNVRWRQGNVAVLKDSQTGYSERDIDAYAWVGSSLYAVHRTVNFGDGYAALRVFLGSLPALVDLSDLFEGQASVDFLDVTLEQQQGISQRLEAVRQTVVNAWVTAVQHTLNAGSLSQLQRMMAPLCLDWSFAAEAVIEPVVTAVRGAPDWALRSVLYDLMRGTTLRMPTWLGDPQKETRCQVYQCNGVGQRYWLTVHQGCTSSISSILATVKLNAGPVGIVVNGTGASARSYVETLIAQKAYGDLVLLEGPQCEAQALAEKFSSQFLGVDILDYAVVGCLAA